MVRSMSLGLWILLLAGTSLFGQQWATKMFETTEHDFGTVARGGKTEFDFALSNLYLEDVHIASVRSSCGCTSPQVITPDLKTYEKGAIRATFNTRAFQGQRGATLTVTIDRPMLAEVQLHVKGFIRSDVVFEPGSVQFGDVDQGGALERKVAVSYAGHSDWRIVAITSADPAVSGKLVETSRAGGQVSYELSVHLAPNAPTGYLSNYLMLVTNDAAGTQIPVLVEGRVLSGITVSPASLFMGVVQPGQKVTKPLVVKSKKPFRILSIDCDDKSFEFGKETDQTPKTLHVIPVTFAAGADSGKVTRTIRIETDLGETTPELAAYAVVSKP
jgi:hypothetical protein